MNELVEKFPSLVIVAVPCNQFGHQENGDGDEILQNLKHVRPGNGYEPKFPLAAKVDVNGASAHPLFNHLKLKLPVCADRSLEDELKSPNGVFADPSRIIWRPVSRADLSWNFEKFLIDKNGVPVKRFSPKFETKDLADEIQKLMA